jgi:hypothetical protein
VESVDLRFQYGLPMVYILFRQEFPYSYCRDSAEDIRVATMAG